MTTAEYQKRNFAQNRLLSFISEFSDGIINVVCISIRKTKNLDLQLHEI